MFTVQLPSRNQMPNLPSLRPGLRHHNLDDQLLVYDQENDQIHLLNSTTAKVVHLIDQGLTSDELVCRLDQIDPGLTGNDALALAMHELRSARLLESNEFDVPKIHESTRRQMMQRIAAAGAAILIPAIITLAPKSAGAQASQLPDGSFCTASGQCASGCCASNSAGSCDNSHCSPNTCSNCRP
jgi:hypothetical protein